MRCYHDQITYKPKLITAFKSVTETVVFMPQCLFHWSRMQVHSYMKQQATSVLCEITITLKVDLKAGGHSSSELNFPGDQQLPPGMREK